MNSRLKHIAQYTLGVVLLLGLIVFTSMKQAERKVSMMAIDITDEDGNLFVDKHEVTNLVNADNSDFVVGKYVRRLDLKELEKRVEVNAFVKDAQAYVDVSGNLKVRLEQTKPIARLFVDGRRDRYIDQYGNLLPLNGKHTARVPIIQVHRSIKWEKNINETQFGTDLLAFLLYVEDDPFWKPQVAFLDIDSRKEMTIQPQVTKQQILFGYPEDVEKKFKKLRLFYSNILPTKGWNTYSMVNVKYENQIVCK